MTNAKTSFFDRAETKTNHWKSGILCTGIVDGHNCLHPVLLDDYHQLKRPRRYYEHSVEWIPKEPTLDAYKKLFAMPEFVGSIFNSFYVSVLCTAVRLLCAAMAAFALTKIPFKGRNAVFGIYVTALMIPSQITFIPLFIIMTNMHLTNSLNAFMLLPAV